MKEHFINTDYGWIYYDSDSGLLYGLYIHKEYRRKGHARELIKTAKQFIENSGYSGKYYAQVEPKDDSINREDLKNFYQSEHISLLEHEHKH